MSADTTDAADTDAERFSTELVAVLSDLGDDAVPWKLRPPESADDPAKLIVGAQPSLVRGRLEDTGYEVRELGLPVERNGWLVAWEVSAG
jgi:hypothetical protein